MANRVEHGKDICKTAPAISEDSMRQFLTEMKLDSDAIKQLQCIELHPDKQLIISGFAFLNFGFSLICALLALPQKMATGLFAKSLIE